MSNKIRRNISQSVKVAISPYIGGKFGRLIRGVPLPSISRDTANDFIADLIIQKRPGLAGRVGESEGTALREYIEAMRENREPVFSNVIKQKLEAGPGFFTTDDASITRFCALYADCVADSDIYATWTPHEKSFENMLPSMRCRLVDYEPFWSSRPWTDALKGRRVLIISPFGIEVNQQYKRKNELFREFSLPDFSLATLTPPVTINGDMGGYSDWFDALDILTQKMDETDYDVAIVGAGAYGLPIASHAKKRGKVGVVMGGALQLMFGIFGQRWLDQKSYRKLINEHWVRPRSETRPRQYKEIDGGAYW